MTARELRKALRDYDAGRSLGTPEHQRMLDFGLWWWGEYLTREQRVQYRKNRNTAWGDLAAIRSNEKLRCLWAIFLM